MKKCPKCKKTKSTTDFSPKKGCKNGFQSYCKLCMANIIKDRYKNDPEFRERAKNYQKDPKVKERKNELRRKRYQNDIEYQEQQKEKAKKYRESPEAKQIRNEREREKRKDPKVRERKNKCAKDKYKNDTEYREQLRKYQRELKREQRKNNPEFRKIENERSKNWYKTASEYRERQKERSKAKYLGITVAEYRTLQESLIQKQSGKCDICGIHITETSLIMDHNHTTGVIRGLLCQQCNLGLGQFRDDADLLKQAAKYLKKHK